MRSFRAGGISVNILPGRYQGKIIHTTDVSNCLSCVYWFLRGTVRYSDTRLYLTINTVDTAVQDIHLPQVLLLSPEVKSIKAFINYMYIIHFSGQSGKEIQ